MNFKIALGQTSTSEVKEENLKKGLDMMKIASEKKADILVLPETYMAYIPLSKSFEEFLSIAEPVDGPFIEALKAEAEKRKLILVVGILEKPEGEQRIYNTTILIGADGSLIAKHRKLHLFDSYGFNESDRIKRGEKFSGAFDTPLAKMGLMACYELRFPELARMLALQGVEVILAPSAWVKSRLKEEHLISLSKARALENTVFLVVVCQTGRIFTGRSMVIDPYGVVICDAGIDEGVVTAEINLDRIKRVREQLPVLQHLRTDIYRKFWTNIL